MRPITGREEIGLFNQLPYVLNGELADDLAHGRRRPEWMWAALRGDRLLARAAWWSRPGNDTPFRLDVLDIDDSLPDRGRVSTGVRLLRAAMAATVPAGSPPPEYSRFVPPGWRESALTRHAVQDRMTILERTGARLFVERLRLEWRPGTPIPLPGGRLVFRPVQDAGELLTLMTLALDGTLDAHSRADLTRMPAREAAVNDYNPIIAYLGVLPRHRGNGYIDDILAEGTRILARHEAPRIRASTDLGNTPMANAFRRAGYVNFEREINMTWS
jgi:hypothetical protein